MFNYDAHGLALQGSRRELITYPRQVIEREPDPGGGLDRHCAGCTHGAQNAAPL
jgi:hypothetical protein